MGKIQHNTPATAAESSEADFDLFVIGGGINGCGIARDAAGRGLTVALAEKGDLGGATSSASTKLFHGGLRYLEYFELRLVREALMEREVLFRAMPHISWPMRFVLPYHEAMRFDGTTPASRVLGAVMPWTRGRRPAWLIRLGLWLYDRLGGRQVLPGTTRLDLRQAPEGAPLKPIFETAFEYSDCWVEDSRLVALNARDAALRGAQIWSRCPVSAARVEAGLWVLTLQPENGPPREVRARMIVNAAGPWVADVLHGTLGANSNHGVRLVRGSHIVTRRLFDHDKCYFFQGRDGRIIFAIPYETDFTLIGTTDADHSATGDTPTCTPEEEAYLIAFANEYLAQPINSQDVVWRYSGVRPLYDDGARSATAATRDYVLKLDRSRGAPALNIFGGKITTYRRLAESALNEIAGQLPTRQGPWTASAPLPGGDFAVDGAASLAQALRQDFPFLSDRWATRLVRAYGTDARALLGNAKTAADLGPDFGATLTGQEVRWLMKFEFAKRAEDVVWRRTKLGLRLNAEEIDALDRWMADAAEVAPAAE
ncbi:MAG: glycerol-3-phosphate dehydrogenase [Pseudomonadota bacterium]